MLTDWWPLMGKCSVGRPSAAMDQQYKKCYGFRLPKNRDEWYIRKGLYLAVDNDDSFMWWLMSI